MFRTGLFLSAVFFLAGCTHSLPDFTARLSTRLPTVEKPQAIGEYALGCLAGAQTFHGNEKGLFLSQLKRGRYWGHPDMISLLTRAGEEFSKRNKTLIIGDLSQSRGGPTLTGHNSHQNGLDVDIWFQMFDSKENPSLLFRETEDMKPVEELNTDQVKLVQYFAQDPSVERLFINATFKKKLCLMSGAQKLSPEEQRKVRAWWGHDDHIHVRIKCPLDSPLCVSQAPVPPGDGCGEELNWWFTEEARTAIVDQDFEELKGVYLNKVRKLPEQCSFYKETF